MLSPVPTRLDRNERYCNQQQRSDKNNGGIQDGAVHHGTGNDQDQPKAAACSPTAWMSAASRRHRHLLPQGDPPA